MSFIIFTNHFFILVISYTCSRSYNGSLGDYGQRGSSYNYRRSYCKVFYDNYSNDSRRKGEHESNENMAKFEVIMEGYESGCIFNCTLGIDKLCCANFFDPSLAEWLDNPFHTKITPYKFDGRLVYKEVKIIIYNESCQERNWCDVYPLSTCLVFLRVPWFNHNKFWSDRKLKKFVVDLMEQKHILTPMTITESSIINDEVKKAKVETTNLKFDTQRY